MELAHYTAEPMAFDPTRTYDQGEFGNGKPRGLWLSVDDDFGWKAWCEDESWNLQGIAHRTLFQVAEDNLLTLSTVAEIREFAQEYRGHPSLPDPLASRWINWPQVAAEYSGLLITPYQWEARLHTETMFYYGWDCASACVWDLETVSISESVSID